MDHPPRHPFSPKVLEASEGAPPWSPAPSSHYSSRRRLRLRLRRLPRGVRVHPYHTSTGVVKGEAEAPHPRRRSTTSDPTTPSRYADNPNAWTELAGELGITKLMIGTESLEVTNMVSQLEYEAKVVWARRSANKVAQAPPTSQFTYTCLLVYMYVNTQYPFHIKQRTRRMVHCLQGFNLSVCIPGQMDGPVQHGMGTLLAQPARARSIRHRISSGPYRASPRAISLAHA
uniref:Uncharacterized protein n=1 Tax=Oryza punctata TaxID=4537 RepID=A0A0E0MFX7_ORYPU